MTATAILLVCLKLLGAKVSYYVPNRIDEGYGLNHDALRTLRRARRDDGRHRRLRHHQRRRSRNSPRTGPGTDHHRSSRNGGRTARRRRDRPSAVAGATVSVRRPVRRGVAFKLAWALCQQASQAKRVTEPMRTFLMQAVGLAAIGTVADVVPLVDENRILVRHGLQSLRQRPTPGIAALMKLTKLDQKPRSRLRRHRLHVGPRLNAAGRLGQAQLAVELLTTDSPSAPRRWPNICTSSTAAAKASNAASTWPPTSRLQEQFDADKRCGTGAGRPRLASRRDRHRRRPAGREVSSARRADRARRTRREARHRLRPQRARLRSARGLAACTHLLVSHGGHAAAAGLKIEDAKSKLFAATSANMPPSRSRAERAHRRTVDRRRNHSRDAHTSNRRADRTPGPLRPRQPAAAALHHRRPPGRAAQADRRQRPPSLAAARAARRALRAVAFGGGDWADESGRQSTAR